MREDLCIYFFFFRNVYPETSFDFLREIGVFNKLRGVVVIVVWSVWQRKVVIFYMKCFNSFEKKRKREEVTVRRVTKRRMEVCFSLDIIPSNGGVERQAVRGQGSVT